MQPEGINWIWEQSPARFTRTDKHPRLQPHLPPIGTHTDAHLLIRLYSSHALQKCLMPPARHTQLRHLSGSVCVPYPAHTCACTQTYNNSGLQTPPPPFSWIQCFHGSHVFCTCRTRRSSLSEGERDQSYRFTGWLLINILQRHTYTASARAYSRIRTQGG